jgi:hypothetical protein
MSYLVQLWWVKGNEKEKLGTRMSKTTIAPQKVQNGAILSQPCEDTDGPCSAWDTFCDVYRRNLFRIEKVEGIECPASLSFVDFAISSMIQSM